MKKKLGKRLVDMLLGSPKAHTIGYQPNRKQKRMQQRLLRKRAAAPARQRYEGRKR